MTSVRSAKAKGAAMEYDCEYSLRKIYPDIYLTKQKGFQQQMDIRDDKAKVTFECKRLKGMSWNQALGFLKKLESRTPIDYNCALLFKSNNQPCLVMRKDAFGKICIYQFEDVYNVPFEKHPSTRNKDNI